MRMSRGKLIILISIASLAISIGAVIFLIQFDLPSPAYANRQELFAWLIYKDLSKQSWQNRVILANRLEQECKNLDWKSLGISLNETQQNRVWCNIPLLIRPWFVEKARSYVKLTAEKRRDYVDRLIDIITAWAGIENLLPNRISGGCPNFRVNENGTVPFSQSSITNLLCSEIDRIVEESDPPDREQISELWQALKVRWFFRNLGS
jgi:hypothetical protein